MSTLWIGTGNPGKIAEFSRLLDPLGIRVLLAPCTEEIEEPSTEVNDGFLENARAKALAYAARTGGVTLAEDSGISVAALNGLPGIFSARFFRLDLEGRYVEKSILEGKPPLSRKEIDQQNNVRLLKLMRSFPLPHRAAVFKVALVVALGTRILFHASEEAYGWIAQQPRGTEGFGYDPLFIGQDTFGKTYAEIGEERKNLCSHRKRVTDLLVAWIDRSRELFLDGGNP